MERIIRTDRRYPLGDYKYITLEDVISGIPDEFVLHPEFTGTVRFMQLVSFEIAYRRYIKLVDSIPYKLGVDEAIKALEDIRMEELEKLKIFMNGQSLVDNDQPQSED